MANPTAQLISGGTLGAFSGVQWGSVQRGGKLWQFVNEPSTDTLGAYLLNAGGSFDLVDAGHGARSIATPMYWDGSTKLCTFWGPDEDTGQMGLQQFDLDLELWGARFDLDTEGNIASTDPQALWLRSDGSWIGFGTFGGDNIHYFTTVYVDSGSPWTVPLDICVNAPPASFANGTSILDSNDVLHCIFQSIDENRWFYQQVLADNTLGVFQEFPGQGGSPQDLSGTAASASTMCIIGDRLLWGVSRNGNDPDTGPYIFPAVYVGTGLANPSWVESDSIDPNEFVVVPPDPFPQPQNPTSYPNLFFRAGTLYACWNRIVYSFGTFPAQDGQIMVGQTMNGSYLTGWTSQSLYDPNLPPPLFPDGDDAFAFTSILSFDSAGAINGASVDYTDTTIAGPEQRYWIGFTIPPSPSGGGVMVLSGASTGARFKPCVRRPGDDFFAAQIAEKVRLERLRKDNWPYAHLFAAAMTIPVNRIGIIPVPDPNVQTTVVQYRVPSGFRFWMDAILEDGPAVFLPGDAIWTVDINAQVPTSPQATKVQGLVSIPVRLGSWRAGEVWPFPMPYVFEPLTVIRSRVTNVNFGTGSDFFTSGLFGFLVPVAKGQGR